MEKQKPRPAADEWCQVGSHVAELAYLGRGHYEAHATTVIRLSPAMVFTADGRRFWRKGTRYEVGGRDRQMLTAKALVFRLVPLDNPHAARLLTDQEG